MAILFFNIMEKYFIDFIKYLFMNILLSNDDGVNASGILASKEAVEGLADVYVVAPSNQQSGIGHALTLYEPLRVDSVKLRDGSLGYGVSGTPTDCINLALFELINVWPDLVISGINTGQNTGKGELSTSGTLGAAMEAASLGIPAIAISQHVESEDIKFNEGEVDFDFTPSIKILTNLVKKIKDKGFPNGVDILNVNVPSNPDSYELEVSTLAERMYWPFIDKRYDLRGKPYYWIDGEFYEGNPEGSDFHNLIVKNKPTITPLTLDMVKDIEEFKKW